MKLHRRLCLLVVVKAQTTLEEEKTQLRNWWGNPIKITIRSNSWRTADRQIWQKRLRSLLGLSPLAPLLTLGLPSFLEDPLLHTFRLPPFLVKSSYKKLYDFFYNASGKILDEGEKMEIQREEACHNLLFATCFNSYSGMKILFPSLLKFIGQAGVKLHKQLAEEIRKVVQSNGGTVTMSGMEQMELMKSVVYETLRIDPPVPLQYGKAKKDLALCADSDVQRRRSRCAGSVPENGFLSVSPLIARIHSFNFFIELSLCPSCPNPI
ncbi:hypothetical protein NE237_006294 [Protea cynaroides]|uniref:Uncharacterized protein n=1 Tax=Protea cynaroides TaxID=273540 RepID=A0A9Q0QV15_9MAGN|nr:hypothetical protein NE237_006294 [Protea cynaroides]